MNSPFNLEQVNINWQPNSVNKRPLVFVHGNTQNDTCGKGIIDFFSRRGHPTLSYDLPGHGDSSLQIDDYQFSDLIDLNLDILKEFALKKPILCGHSLGGMIQAGTIARYQLDKSSLILCGSYDSNPVESAHNQHQTSQAIIIDESLKQYIQEGFELFTIQKKYDYFAHRWLSDLDAGVINRRFTQPQANANNLTSLSGFSARAELSKLAIPILVLHGEQEDVIPPELINEMASHYSNIQICWFPKLGHYAFYQNPKLTEEYLDNFYLMITKSS